mgnify:CR=1 FL=1
MKIVLVRHGQTDWNKLGKIQGESNIDLNEVGVEQANNVAEKLKDEKIDLIILDLMLPDMDGFEICKQIREKKNTPIIMVSAKKDDIDKIRGLGLGADDYVTKPFLPVLLKEVIYNTTKN